MSVVVVFLLLVCGAAGLPAQERGSRGLSGPAEAFSVIPGRPTDRSITLSVLSATASEMTIEYGPSLAADRLMTGVRSVPAGVPCEFELAELQADTKYSYRVLSQAPREGERQAVHQGTFHTQRAPGSTFTFSVQGDSHPEREGRMYDPALYAITMANARANPPDFHIMMGDDFSIERLINNRSLTQPAVDQVYALQRSYLGVIGRAASLFLVNGNHEQAARANLDGTPANAAVLAGRARTRFFPLPAPDAFYTGNTEEVPHLGLPRDYYAWTWGDALFVVLDFYWHTSTAVDNEAGGRQRAGGGKQREGNRSGSRQRDIVEKQEGGRPRDMWAITLGEAQYRWLEQTLARSAARWKFVFCHHVLGTGRGGVEVAGLYEWGGRDRRGGSSFAEKRPGWSLPIHELMVKSGVTILFQGHDHLFARQELDGIVYQSCPNPADPTYQAFNREAYRSGEVLPNSGHLRVTVAPESVRVDYVRSFLPADETSDRRNGMLAHSYTLHAPPAVPSRTTAKSP